MEWLLTKGKFSLGELHKLSFSSKTVSANINSFLKNLVQKAYDKRKLRICSHVLVCKEDRELVTKSEIVVLTKIFSLLNLALEKMQLEGRDAQLEAWMRECLKDLQGGLSGGPAVEISRWFSQLNQQFFVEMAIYIILVPQVFKLQLLVEDRELETSLRRHALKYLQSVCALADAE
mgnify:CR=1 FL=1